MIVRRQRDLRGRFYLAVRSAKAYRRKEILHYLGCALGVPCDQLLVLEESCVPEDLPIRELGRVSGKPAAPFEEKMDAFVRPLRPVATAVPLETLASAAGEMEGDESFA